MAELTASGIGLEGVRRILELENQVAALQGRVRELEDDLAAAQYAVQKVLTEGRNLPAVPAPGSTSASVVVWRRRP